MEIEDADECLKEYSKAMQATSANMEPVIPNKKFVSSSSASVLIPEPSTTASSFDFTLGGRFLNITSAVSRQEANKLTNESEKRRQKEDKRNLYLMKEGVIMQDSEAAKDLTPSELSKRHASYVQRKKMITENPNLFISKTRLSVRNLGRNITDHMLRVVGRLGVDRYWKQIEAGLRSDVLEPEVVEEELKEKRKTPSLGRKVVVKQVRSE